MLYERNQDKHRPPIVKEDTKLFTIEDINQGIKRMVGGKAQDIDGLQAEYLKWGRVGLAPHIKNIFNKVTQEGSQKTG